MKNIYWDHFLKTGNIKFYLKYREEMAIEIVPKIGDNHDEIRGNCSKNNELQRK